MRKRGTSTLRVEDMKKKDDELLKTPEAAAARSLFEGYKLTDAALKSMLRRWGRETVDMIKKSPYRVAREIDGISFETMDMMAMRKFGFRVDDPERIQAGIVEAFKRAAVPGGHTCLPAYEALSESAKLVSGFSTAMLKIHFDVMKQNGDLVDYNGMTFWKTYYDYERVTAMRVREMLEHDVLEDNDDIRKPDLAHLHDDQKEAIQKAIEHRVFILTGAPGTGKTFTIKTILDTFGAYRVLLAAPTGKAARRVTEQSERPALTMHRLLEWTPEGFLRGEDNPLEADLVVLDEVSMVDSWLMASLMKALSLNTRLILVGDKNQLPAVQAGNVLHEMLASGVVPSVELTKIKRQNPGLLVQNCSRVKDGKDLLYTGEEPVDFRFIDIDDPVEIRDRILDLVLKELPAKGAKPEDVQILTPRRNKTVLCADEMSLKIQEAVNHNPAVAGTIYRLGDRVIQTRNDYDNDVMNGDIGYVKELDVDEKELVVEFDKPSRIKRFPMRYNSLSLAYALTVHKFQGSEAPYIIIPIHDSAGIFLLQRNWFYTALSRAQKLCIVVGQRKLVVPTIGRIGQQKRYSKLADMLKSPPKEA